MADNEDKDLKLSEQQDGSVMVGGDDTPSAKNESDEDEKAGEENDHPDEQAIEGESEEDAEERRERNRMRRAENKQRRKDYIESLKRDIAARDEVLQQTMQRLDAVERRTTSADIAMVDAEMQKAADAYNYYKQVHSEAVTAANGQVASDAYEKMFAAMRRAEDLNRIKEAARRPQQTQQPLDPRLKANAEGWMARNSWYDPNAGDMDSRVAFTIDNQLAAEGWNPTTEQYWTELDSRLKKYLPHRYNSGYNQGQSSTNNRPPPVAGSGRESTNKSGGYRLSAERVQALKEAGAWDDPVQRAAMIKRYQEFDKQEGAR